MSVQLSKQNSYKQIHTYLLQPRPQGFSLKKWVGPGKAIF